VVHYVVVEAGFVEEDVMFLMVYLKQLARRLCSLVGEALYVEFRGLRSSQLDLRRSRHGAVV